MTAAAWGVLVGVHVEALRAPLGFMLASLPPPDKKRWPPSAWG